MPPASTAETTRRLERLEEELANQKAGRLERLERAVGALAADLHAVTGPDRLARKSPALAELLREHLERQQEPVRESRPAKDDNVDWFRRSGDTRFRR